MKILKFDRQIADPLPPFREIPGGGIPVGLIPDSAINRNRLPVFIPDFAREGWRVELWLAARISRLGKFIAPRFSPRYIDGLSLCALLSPAIPSGKSECESVAGSPSLESGCGCRFGVGSNAPDCEIAAPAPPLFFDCALTVGELLPFGQAGRQTEMQAGRQTEMQTGDLAIATRFAPLRQETSETITDEMLIPAESLQAGELIARASVYCTLKSGDLILLGFTGLSYPATLNRSLEATVNSLPALSTRLK